MYNCHKCASEETVVYEEGFYGECEGLCVGCAFRTRNRPITLTQTQKVQANTVIALVRSGGFEPHLIGRYGHETRERLSINFREAHIPPMDAKIVFVFTWTVRTFSGEDVKKDACRRMQCWHMNMSMLRRRNNERIDNE